MADTGFETPDGTGGKGVATEGGDPSQDQDQQNPAAVAPAAAAAVAEATSEQQATELKLKLLESQLASLNLSLQAESAARLRAEEERRRERELSHEILRELRGQRGHLESEHDGKTYLDVHDVADRIAPGLQERPERAAPNKPHLFDITKDATARLLSDRSYHAGLEEYRLLYCNTFYLSCGLKRLEETVGASLEAPEDEALIRPILNTLATVEDFFRRRLAYVRVKLRATAKDVGYMDWLQTQLYGVTDAGFSGSSDIDKMEREYFQQYTKQIMVQGAKTAASASTSSSGDKAPRKRWSKRKPDTSSDGSTANSSTGTKQ